MVFGGINEKGLVSSTVEVIEFDQHAIAKMRKLHYQKNKLDDYNNSTSAVAVASLFQT